MSEGAGEFRASCVVFAKGNGDWTNRDNVFVNYSFVYFTINQSTFTFFRFFFIFFFKQSNDELPVWMDEKTFVPKLAIRESLAGFGRMLIRTSLT